MAQKLSNLAIGAKIKLGKHQLNSETALPIIWVVADKNHSGYPANSVTLITQKLIDIRSYDGKEPNTSTSGNPDYALSNINQWLNSSASAGKWYSATHANDTPPNASTTINGGGYEARPGFLYNFTENERLALLPTTLQLGNATTNTTTSKVFLPSEREILGTGSVEDGSSRFAYFVSNPVTCTFTEQAFINTTSTVKPETVSETWRYLTRSFNSTSVRCISATSGAEQTDPRASAGGLRPVVNLSATAKISNTTDSDGCYTLIVNNLPSISGTTSDLGTKSVGFSHSYSISDGDNEAVTVTEYIDNTSIRSYVATLGSTNTFAVTGNTWLKLSNGTHTLKITATDGWDTATRTITFVKSVNKLVVQRTTPMGASKRPSQIVVSLVKTIPYNAKLTVEVCNNGFDASPVWETLDTSSIYSGLAHEFDNEVCTAGKWGVNIRVTVDRNGGEGACYISEIGGNFE